MMRQPGTGPDPIANSHSPSGRNHTSTQEQTEPTDSEVADMVMAYANSPGDAASLDFDCVEIHGAHGYLIDELFWGVMNTRFDNYGGRLIERARFAGEVIAECRAQIGNDIPIVFR